MKKAILLLAGVVLGAAGCTSSVPGGLGSSRSTAIQQDPVVGEWVGTDGVAISSFNPGGSFTSRFAETGETLTTGTYSQRDASTYDLSFYSIRSERNIAATCALVSEARLNCTSDSGATFSLMRRGTV